MEKFLIILVILGVVGICVMTVLFLTLSETPNRADITFELELVKTKLDYCQWNCEPYRFIDPESSRDCVRDCLSSNEWEEATNWGSFLYE